MRKMISLLLALVVLAACFAACGSNDSESKEELSNPEQSAVSAEESSEPVSEEDPCGMSGS